MKTQENPLSLLMHMLIECVLVGVVIAALLRYIASVFVVFGLLPPQVEPAVFWIIAVGFAFWRVRPMVDADFKRHVSLGETVFWALIGTISFVPIVIAVLSSVLVSLSLAWLDRSVRPPI